MNPGYDYAGEIVDPEQTPLTASVYECRECGALATSLGMATHLAWHRKQVITGHEAPS